MNCFGAKDLKPYLQEIAKYSPHYISVYPNAGLPNQFGEYDESPETMAAQVQEFIDEGLVNIIGGCCGTTPEHIAAFAQMVKFADLRTPNDKQEDEGTFVLSGLSFWQSKKIRCL